MIQTDPNSHCRAEFQIWIGGLWSTGHFSQALFARESLAHELRGFRGAPLGQGPEFLLELLGKRGHGTWQRLATGKIMENTSKIRNSPCFVGTSSANEAIF